MTIAQLALGLLAYTLALYALAARDQRSPYLTSAAYGTTFAVLLGGLAAFASSSVVPEEWVHGRFILDLSAQACLAFGVVKILYATIHLRNRRVNFRDDHRLSNFRLVRDCKTLQHRMWPKATYTHDPDPWPPALLDALRQSSVPSMEDLLQRLAEAARLEIARSPTVTLAVECNNLAHADQLLVPLAAAFLSADCLVQYMSCARHPVHFIAAIRARHAQELKASKRADLITAIDAYTPHFGFTDSVHDRMRERIKGWGIHVIQSGPSYAGMHTASARAFNRAKSVGERDAPGGARRKPTLVIYEGARALVDLESEEQYRVFMRHVLPSEQLWGGMLTVFAEYGSSDTDKAVLRAYADVYIEETAKSTS